MTAIVKAIACIAVSILILFGGVHLWWSPFRQQKAKRQR